MRIVYLAWQGSVHTRRWVRFFAERGHDVHVVTCGDGSVTDTDEHGTPIPQPWNVHDLGKPRFGKIGYLLKVFTARKVIRALEPEIVHAHWLTSYGLLALAAGVQPLVVTGHGDDVLTAPKRRIFRALVTRVLKAAQMITVPSDVMRDRVLELLGDAPQPPAGVIAFQYGVETRRLAAIGTKVRTSHTDEYDSRRGLRIISARALLRLYRIDALLDALAELDRRDIQWTCDIVGDGPLRADLELQARELGVLGRTVFHGHVPSHDVERMVAGSDVYVSVSESDGVSLSLLEALSLGVVPVLSDIPANRPWVNDGKTGELVEIDPVQIADGIIAASLLDREQVAADNFAIVSERADRDTNLAACELLMDTLTGVVFDPVPVQEDESAPRGDASDGGSESAA